MNKLVNSYIALGLMSGTSLDGLDLCISNFKLINNKWSFEIIEATTIQYSKEWIKKLVDCEAMNGDELIKLHFDYGKHLGETAKDFINQFGIGIDFIASHGHTIFHQPQNGFTFQLGHGAALASSSGVQVISDFRSQDISLNGQGAPLVPIGDLELFPEYDCCINFGGICNFSIHEKKELIAYDIVPCNMVLNYLMKKYYGLEFDQNGKKSESGKIDQKLYDELNQLDYFKQNIPKSLGKEWIYDRVIPLIDSHSAEPEDKLHTYTTHISHQLDLALKKQNINGKILLSGGGAKNKFLIDLLNSKGHNLYLPNEQLIDFKEALIFAFLGIKRLREEINVHRSVTASTKNTCSGCIYLP